LPSVFEAEPLAIAQAAEILGQAAREGRRVSIDRAGGDLVVSTRYLNRLLEHEAGDLTATVEVRDGRWVRIGPLYTPAAA